MNRWPALRLALACVVSAALLLPAAEFSGVSARQSTSGLKVITPSQDLSYKTGRRLPLGYSARPRKT